MQLVFLFRIILCAVVKVQAASLRFVLISSFRFHLNGFETVLFSPRTKKKKPPSTKISFFLFFFCPVTARLLKDDCSSLRSTFRMKRRCFHLRLLLRKEVIQPHLPIRLPCYDFTPVIGLALDGWLLAVASPALGTPNSHGVTGGVYKARERIHRGMLIRDY